MPQNNVFFFGGGISRRHIKFEAADIYDCVTNETNFLIIICINKVTKECQTKRKVTVSHKKQNTVPTTFPSFLASAQFEKMTREHLEH